MTNLGENLEKLVEEIPELENVPRYGFTAKLNFLIEYFKVPYSQIVGLDKKTLAQVLAKKYAAINEINEQIEMGEYVPIFDELPKEDKEKLEKNRLTEHH